MVSLVQQLPHIYQAVKVEAMVASKAMEFGKEIGVAKVIIEEDSATVVKALCSSDKGLTSYGWLVSDTALYFGFFSELSYSRAMREGNRVAHSLTRQAVFFRDSTVWMEDVSHITYFFVQAGKATL